MTSNGGKIYFVRAADFVKIGWSTQVRTRLGALQTGNPYRLEVIGSIDGTLEEERALHDRFATSRLEGEWFKLTREIVAFIHDRVGVLIELSESPTIAASAKMSGTSDALIQRLRSSQSSELKRIFGDTGLRPLWFIRMRWLEQPALDRPGYGLPEAIDDLIAVGSSKKTVSGTDYLLIPQLVQPRCEESARIYAQRGCAEC